MTEQDRSMLRLIEKYYDEFPEDIGKIFSIEKLYYCQGPVYLARFIGKQNELYSMCKDMQEAESVTMQFISDRIKRSMND